MRGLSGIYEWRHIHRQTESHLQLVAGNTTTISRNLCQYIILLSSHKNQPFFFFFHPIFGPISLSLPVSNCCRTSKNHKPIDRVVCVARTWKSPGKSESLSTHPLLVDILARYHANGFGYWQGKEGWKVVRELATSRLDSSLRLNFQPARSRLVWVVCKILAVALTGSSGEESRV